MTSDDLRYLVFVEGTGTDGRGRTFESILASDFDFLEAQHDFIQWLFPLPERSQFNFRSPILTEAVIDAFAAKPQLRANLRRALDRMLAFYGLAMTESGGPLVVSPTPDFAERRKVWLRPYNHNHLRLTRILRSCYLLSLRAEAAALGGYLDDLAAENPETLNEETRGYWARASVGRR
jgi:opioid growth factor receptor-like protein